MTEASDNDPDTRARELIGRMTLDQKIHMVHGHVDSRYIVPAIEELGIPALRMTDGPSGVNAGGDASTATTAFPSSLALAATWEPELARQQGNAIAKELLVHEMNVLLAPNLDVVRHPWWGRATEQYGEEPLLIAEMGSAFIEGVQEEGVIANAKHFLGYTQETGRMDANNILLDEATMREIYLTGFEKAVVVANVDSVMSSFNQVNGEHTTESSQLIDILKKEWSLKGWIMSDYGSLKSTIPAALAGFDQEMPGTPPESETAATAKAYGLEKAEDTGKGMYSSTLKAAVLSGDVPLSRLDDMVHRILRTMFNRGTMDRKVYPTTFDVEEHRSVARRVAENSLTLLKNDPSLLPLTEIKRLVLIGADADHRTASGGASVVTNSTANISLLAGLQKACDERGISFEYVPGGDKVGPASMLEGPSAVPSSCLRPDMGSTIDGLNAQYWTTHDRSAEPTLERTDAQVLFDVGFLSQLMNASALPTLPGKFGDPMYVKWTGFLVVPVSGEYKLSLTCMGSGQLKLDGHVLLRIDGARSPEVRLSDPLQLKKNEAYALEIIFEMSEHMNWLELGNLRFGWVAPIDCVTPNIASAVERAREADAVIIFAHPYESEQRDRNSLSLPNDQDSLIAKVAEANKRTVVVVSSGGPILMPWENSVGAIIQTYHPGQEGGCAVASALFGEINPSGHLPITYPVSETDVPVKRPTYHGTLETVIEEGIYVGYRSYERQGISPLFPFGHGLSYTNFTYDNLEIVRNPIQPDHFKVRLQVKNTGDFEGADVVQLYATEPHLAEGTLKRLLKFRKLALMPGEVADVEFVISPRDLGHWDPDGKDFRVKQGEFLIEVGQSSTKAQCSASFRV